MNEAQPGREFERPPVSMEYPKEPEWRDVTADAYGIHEITETFDHLGVPLNETLQEMLGEHHDQLSDRKGSGFTQATRHLAEYIGHRRGRGDERLLGEDFRRAIDKQVQEELPDNDRSIDYIARLDRKALESGLAKLEGEGSQAVGRMIHDILYPFKNEQHTLTELPSVKEKMKIGTCTTAEVYFLKYLNKPDPENPMRNRGGDSGGHVNYIVDEKNRPVMIEKIGLGENHSCLTLKEMVLNGVRLPPGSLVGVEYTEGHEPKTPKQKSEIMIESVTKVSDCEGFEFLRLTTLAVSPEGRHQAFGPHLEFQKQMNMIAPGTATVEEFVIKAGERTEKILTPSLIEKIRNSLMG